MIILFTSNFEGGILQLANQLLQELLRKNIDTCCYAPEEASPNIWDENTNKVIYYKKPSKFTDYLNKQHEILCSIVAMKPDLIWVLDEAIFSCLVGLGFKSVVQLMSTVHDVRIHPHNHWTLSKTGKGLIRFCLKNRLEKISNYCLLLSEESKDAYLRVHWEYKNKILLLPLGAHIPEHLTGQKPEEFSKLEMPYFLFFGRIDRYKGLEKLFEIYGKLSDINYYLIIAGQGTLTRREAELIDKNSQIMVLNRYIADAEMLWLFQNARALVLPYIEVSQSGIIPIAFKLGVPVIASDLPGFCQFIYNGWNGFICGTEEDYINAFHNVCEDAIFTKIQKNELKYYTQKLDWCNNIDKLRETLLKNYGLKI